MPTSETLTINLTNTTSSNTVYAYITGLALSNGSKWFLLQSDGKTAYYPDAPASILQPLTVDCSIPLGPPATTKTVEIPRIAGGRIYFSINEPLIFLLNPGPALVEPSVTNPGDENFKKDWGFMEFTFNADQVYANVSFVDFVSIPVSLKLVCGGGEEKVVKGLRKDGLVELAKGLEEQRKKDGEGWDKLIVKDKDEGVLRVLSPNQAIVMDGKLLEGYYDTYISKVWEKYQQEEIKIDTQSGFGVCCGKIDSNDISIDGQKFCKPSTRDIFNASSGPFQTGGDAKRNAVIPRLNAAFNRSTLLSQEQFPADLSTHYNEEVTNHYARLVHEVSFDGRGYAHPYDDVAPTGGKDVSGFVNDGDPKVLEVFVGGLDG